MWVLPETDLGDNSKKEQHLQCYMRSLISLFDGRLMLQAMPVEILIKLSNVKIVPWRKKFSQKEIFLYLCQIREIKFLRKIICIIIVTLFWFYQFLKFSITNNFINLSWTMQAILNIRQAPHQMTQGSRKILVPVRVLIRQIMWKRTSHLAMQASNNIDSL